MSTEARSTRRLATLHTFGIVPGPRGLDEDEAERGGELPPREAAAARDLAHGRGGVDVEQHLSVTEPWRRQRHILLAPGLWKSATPPTRSTVKHYIVPVTQQNIRKMCPHNNL